MLTILQERECPLSIYLSVTVHTSNTSRLQAVQVDRTNEDANVQLMIMIAWKELLRSLSFNLSIFMPPSRSFLSVRSDIFANNLRSPRAFIHASYLPPAPCLPLSKAYL